MDMGVGSVYNATITLLVLNLLLYYVTIYAGIVYCYNIQATKQTLVQRAYCLCKISKPLKVTLHCIVFCASKRN